MLHKFVKTNFEQALQRAQQDLHNPMGPIDDERMLEAVKQPSRQGREELVLEFARKGYDDLVREAERLEGMGYHLS
jgi:hypothetical protein